MQTFSRTPEYDKIHLAVMAIIATAKELNVSDLEMYKRLKHEGLIKSLLFDCYDTLHCESLAGVVWNTRTALENRGKND